MPDLINRIQLGALLGVSPPTARNVVLQDGFPSPVMIGKRAKWRREDVLAWVAGQ